MIDLIWFPSLIKNNKNNIFFPMPGILLNAWNFKAGWNNNVSWSNPLLKSRPIKYFFNLYFKYVISDLFKLLRFQCLLLETY